MLLYSIVAHAHLLHPIQARDLINQLAKKLVSLLTVSQYLLSSLESSCLAICSPLYVSAHCRLFLYGQSKKLAFVLVASAMTAIHRDRLVLASYTPRPEIQLLESRGQIVSADVP